LYLLDTDTVSNFLDRRRQNARLRERLLAEPVSELRVSIITVEEMLRGALDAVRDAQKKKRSVAAASAFLGTVFDDLHQFPLLPHTELAERLYQEMPPDVKRIGTNDCRIAAAATSLGCTLVTANTQHFQRIGVQHLEDWTRRG
jgi:tRNA(fMet)-specific endonuclease VapC